MFERDRLFRKRVASFFLVIMTLGGLVCPCRGIPASIGHEHSTTSQDCSAAYCECCKKQAPDQLPAEPPSDCCCLSGFCSPYVLPAESLPSLNLRSTEIHLAFPPSFEAGLVWTEPQRGYEIPVAFRSSPSGTRLPGI